MLQKQAGMKRGEGESERTTATSPGIMLPELADVEKRGWRPDRSMSWCAKTTMHGTALSPSLGRVPSFDGACDIFQNQVFTPRNDT